MREIEQAATAGLAGYAFGRLVAFDTVTQPALNRVFLLLVDPVMPDGLFAGFEDSLAGEADRLARGQLMADVYDGTADLRQLHRDGWTAPKNRAAEFLADLLSCPICVSFHSLWLAAVATGKARPLSASWWLRLFSGWGAAQVLLRLPATSGALDEGGRVSNALQHATANGRKASG